MSKGLRIQTLGGVHIELDGEPIQGLASRKAEALMIYLAVTRRIHPREHLADLLWDDRPESQALGNLSVLLTSLRKQLGSYLEISRNSIAVSTDNQIWVDFVELDEIVRGFGKEIGKPRKQFSERLLERYEQTIDLYQGDFLAGFHLREARAFEEWTVMTRERLHYSTLGIFEDLIDHYNNNREYSRASQLAQKSLALDSLRERTHRQLILSLARQSKFNEAVAYYNRCRKNLLNELEVEPSQETRALFERIQAAARRSPSALPQSPGPFIGRNSSLEAIIKRLTNPECHLLTLMGPGGIGKTRLAIEAARDLEPDFLNGIYFIPLAPLTSHTQIAATIADNLQLSFDGEGDSETQLANYLREKEMLLILDNFEHLLSGSQLLATIIETAPNIKLLATSRTRLNLTAEWLYEVEGLTYPAGTGREKMSPLPDDETSYYSAIRLFTEIARRIQPDFTLNAERAEAIGYICQLVEGIPLAIELAATWVRSLSCEEIASEIARNIDILASNLHDLPLRHRRMRAVFDHSWRLLTPHEQEILPKLTVFSAGFDRTAAQEVGGASLIDLSSLVDKSLVKREEPAVPFQEARYNLHDLLANYMAQKLDDKEIIRDTIRRNHCEYFITRVKHLYPKLHGSGQSEALDVIRLEIENLRLAWDWGIRNILVIDIRLLMEAMHIFFWVRGRYREAYQTWVEAVSLLEQAQTENVQEAGRLSTTIASLQNRTGLYAAHLQKFDEAENLITRALETSRQMNASDEVVFGLNTLGSIYRMRGKYHEAKLILTEALSKAEEIHSPWLVANVYNTLGSVAYRLSEYEEALNCYTAALEIRQEIGDLQGIARANLNLGSVHYRIGNYPASLEFLNRSLEQSRGIGDLWGEAACQNNMGNVYVKLKEFDLAQALYEQSLSIKADMGHRKGVTQGLANLGKLAFNRGEFRKARGIYREALAGSREIEDKWALSNGLSGLGRVELALGELMKAEGYFREALEIAWQLEALILIEQALVDFAELWLARGNTETGIDLARFIADLPARSYEVQERANAVLQVQGEAFLELHEEGVFAAADKGLEEIVASLLTTGP